MKRKAIAIITTVIALMIMAQGALATDVLYSRQYKNVKAAREAVLEKYGLTHETLGLFDENLHTDTATGNTIFTYTPFPPFMDAEAVGIYEVAVKNGKVKDVTWTFDRMDLDELSNGHLDMLAWGQAQIQNALEIEKLKVKAGYAEYYETYVFTDEDQAALEKLYEDAHYPEASRMNNLLPRAQDIGEELAVQLAKEAIVQRYGVDMEIFDGFDLFSNYHREPNARTAVYYFQWQKGDSAFNPAEFMAEVVSPSGRVSQCYWLDNGNLKLPEGPLDDYFVAVSEYIQSGAFLRLTHAERAELWERIGQMKHSPAGHVRYVMPSDTDISEEEAIEAARAALDEMYGFTEDMESLFERTIVYRIVGEEPCWVIGYKPALKTYIYNSDSRMGEYNVTIRGSDKELLNAFWTNDHWFESGQKTTKTNWGQADCWDASVLPFLKALDEQRYEMEQAHEDTDGAWPMEDYDAYDQLCRDAGFDSKVYWFGAPDVGDLSQEEALAAAKLAFSSEYGLSEKDFEQYHIGITFSVADPERHVWILTLTAKEFPVNENAYYMELFCKNGEIVSSWHVTTGHG